MGEVLQLKLSERPWRLKERYEEQAKRKLLLKDKKRYHFFLARSKHHALVALLGFGLTVFIGIAMWIQGLFPQPPDSLTYRSIADWTLTPEWKGFFDPFLCGVCIAYTTIHLLKLFHHLRLKRIAQKRISNGAAL